MQSYGTKNMLEHGIHTAFYKETNLLCVHIYWLWMGQGAQGWCTGITQRDGMGRELGGGVQDGEHMYTHGGFISMCDKTTTIL